VVKIGKNRGNYAIKFKEDGVLQNGWMEKITLKREGKKHDKHHYTTEL
jgi:hypothetical protein